MNKHVDRRDKAENLTLMNFGGENRMRIAISTTPPTGHHEGSTKETRYAINGKDVLTLDNKHFSYVLMGSHANGKDTFFECNSNPKAQTVLEATIPKGKVGAFVNALSHCYDDYVPRNAQDSIPFRFPVATTYYSYTIPNSVEGCRGSSTV